MLTNTNTVSKEFFRMLTPSTAKAIIVAELKRDTSDIQCDHFSSRTEERVVLGFSKHTRDVFSELRKMAATFEPTQHLGPGKDQYYPRVAFANDAGMYWTGCSSPFHYDLYHNSLGEPIVFSTRKEAETFVAKAENLCSIFLNTPIAPNQIAEFEWLVGTESVEHREKYSMGHGYYLGTTRYSGWQVRKVHLNYFDGCNTVDVSSHEYHP